MWKLWRFQILKDLRLPTTKLCSNAYRLGQIPTWVWIPEGAKQRLAWNIVNTFIHQAFQEYIQDKVRKRESQLIKADNLKIWVTPEIVDIIKRSKAVSTSKGKSHFLLRPVINWKSKKLEKLEREKEEADSRYLDELHENLKRWRALLENIKK